MEKGEAGCWWFARNSEGEAKEKTYKKKKL